MSRHRLVSWLGAGALGISFALQPTTAEAATNDSKGPGIAGGLLLGAEVVLLAEAAFGVGLEIIGRDVIDGEEHFDALVFGLGEEVPRDGH